MSIHSLLRQFTCMFIAVVICITPVDASDHALADMGLYKWVAQQWQRLQKPESAQNYQPIFSDQIHRNTQEYLVGIHPLHNPKRLFEIYGPIIDRINLAMPDVTLKLEASRNYEEFDKKLYSGRFDFAMPNPYQTVLSLAHGYRVFGKMGDDNDFRGIILVRKDSGIQQVSDLKGKAVSYPAATALAATMMPQQYLHTHGLNINTDIDNRYVGSQESSIMNVLLGHVAAAATWPVPWKAFVIEHPEQAEQLEIKWQTAPLINNGWVVRQDVPPALLKSFSQQLFSLHNDEAGRKLLQNVPISRFEVANDQTFDPVRVFLDHFNRTVRAVKQ